MPLSRLPAWIYMIVAVLPAFAAIPLSRSMDLGLETNAVLSLLIVLWAFAFGGIGWRRLDEPARAAQKAAWFWGASFGLLALLIACAVAMLWPDIGAPFAGLIERMSAGRGDLVAFTIGVLTAGTAQVVGAIIVWAVWWIKRR